MGRRLRLACCLVSLFGSALLCACSPVACPENATLSHGSCVLYDSGQPDADTTEPDGSVTPAADGGWVKSHGGSGGKAGGGGTGGQGGAPEAHVDVPPPPPPPFTPHSAVQLPSGRSVVAAGAHMRSEHFSLLTSLGQAPGTGSPLRSSANYRLVGGIVGVLQSGQ